MKKYLGDILLEKGYIKSADLDRALTTQTTRILDQKPSGGWVTAYLLDVARTMYNRRGEHLLGKILMEMKLLPETQVAEALEIQRTSPLERPKGKLQALHQVILRLNSSFNLIDLLQQILVLAADLAGAESASLIIYDHSKDALVILMPTGPHAEKLRDLEIPKDRGIVGWVYRTATSVIVNDTSADPRFYPGIDAKVGYTSRQILCVPLTVKDKRLGALEVINKTDREAGDPLMKANGFTKSDLLLLEMFSAQAAIAIENTRLSVECARADADILTRKEQLVTATLLRGGSLVARSLLAQMRSSLAPLKGYAGRMREITPDLRAEKYGGYIDRELERIIGSAEDMVRYFRGTYAPRREKLDVMELLAELQAHTWVDCRVSGISLTAAAPPGLAVHADREMLLRALELLFRNSREAMPDGGEFSVRAAQAGAHIVLEIQDSGSGIPEGWEERVFEPFFTEGKANAAGLGLPIVRRIVDAHGGTVTAGPRPEGGARFTITIPPA